MSGRRRRGVCARGRRSERTLGRAQRFGESCGQHRDVRAHRIAGRALPRGEARVVASTISPIGVMPRWALSQTTRLEYATAPMRRPSMYTGLRSCRRSRPSCERPPLSLARIRSRWGPMFDRITPGCGLELLDRGPLKTARPTPVMPGFTSSIGMKRVTRARERKNDPGRTSTARWREFTCHLIVTNRAAGQGEDDNGRSGLTRLLALVRSTHFDP